jgi:hypothetical protein
MPVPVDTAQAEDFAGTIGDKRLVRLYEYWLLRKGSHGFPSRGDLDPLDFRYLLGHIMLVDVSYDPLRFQVRLHGTEMVQRAGYELSGKFLDELPVADYRDYVIEQCKGLVQSGEPLAVRHNRMLDGRIRRYEALWLPLSDDNCAVTMLLCALIYDGDGRAVA